MSNAASFDELLNRAFQLAYFIHTDKPTALRVAFDAAAKLEVAAVAQTKRLYYTLGKRSSSKALEAGAVRTKVFFSDRHLLQRLVYVESEKYEREREADAELIDEAQMLVHFIKHLVRVTLKRSSFYVALGTSRVLHNYTTSETMEIYNVVVQDPERAKDDYYYRSRKSRLMEELKERFGAFLQIAHGQRGEERFQMVHSIEEDQACLVREALRRFTPWNTPCPVPAGFDPLADDIKELSTGKSVDEDAVELNRMHATLHPDCYERLTRALKLASPLERLALPEFSLAKGTNNMNGRSGERRPPFLSGDELQRLNEELSEQAARRKKSYSNLLSIMIDGREQARLDPRRARALKLPVSENAEMVEVYAVEAGTRTLLAVHLLDAEGIVEERSTNRSEIVLESGQKICFALRPNENAGQDGVPLLLTVAYRETKLSRALELLRARARASIVASLNGAVRGARDLWKPAFAVVLLIFCASLFALFKQAGDGHPDALIAQRAHSTPPDARESVIVPLSHTSAQATTTQRSSVEAKTRNGDAQATGRPALMARGRTPPRGANRAAGAITRTEREPARANSAPESVGGVPSIQEETRTLLSQTDVRSMFDVKTVYIEAFSDQSSDQELSRSLKARVKAGARWVVTENANQADAALKLTVKPWPGDSLGSRSEDSAGGAATTAGSGVVRLTFTARLVNEEGKILWQMSGAAKGNTRDKAIERAALRTAEQLMKELRRVDKTK
jgi:hypothetical protein